MRRWSQGGLRTPIIAAFALVTWPACATGLSVGPDDASTGGGSSPDSAAESTSPEASLAGDGGDAGHPTPGDATLGDSAPTGDATLGDSAPTDDASADSAPTDSAPTEDSSDATDAVALADAPADTSSPPTCTGTEILCGSACVDPTHDPNHCGACGVVCSTGLCGTTVSADMTTAPSTWHFNGSAAWSSAGPSAQMTAAAAAGVTGTVIYENPIATDGFTAAFQFRIGAGGGGRYDGMGFMIESSGATSVGATNGSLGMGGLGGYGVEFDIYNNGQCGDTSSDHVGVDSLLPCTSATSLPTSLFASGDLTSKIDLANGQWHAATVTLSSGAMSVTVDSDAIAQSVALPNFVSGTPYYYGFSGATGGNPGNGGMQTEVKAVTLTFPTPRCL
jgi:hypothetical protein